MLLTSALAGSSLLEMDDAVPSEPGCCCAVVSPLLCPGPVAFPNKGSAGIVFFDPKEEDACSKESGGALPQPDSRSSSSDQDDEKDESLAPSSCS